MTQQTNYYEINGQSTSNQQDKKSSSSSNLINNTSGNNGSNRPIERVPSDSRLSKQSFHQAMGNPCEFFIDVM
jgi:hypothetical protein